MQSESKKYEDEIPSLLWGLDPVFSAFARLYIKDIKEMRESKQVPGMFLYVLIMRHEELYLIYVSLFIEGFQNASWTPVQLFFSTLKLHGSSTFSSSKKNRLYTLFEEIQVKKQSVL